MLLPRKMGHVLIFKYVFTDADVVLGSVFPFFRLFEKTKNSFDFLFLHTPIHNPTSNLWTGIYDLHGDALVLSVSKIWKMFLLLATLSSLCTLGSHATSYQPPIHIHNSTVSTLSLSPLSTHPTSIAHSYFPWLSYAYVVSLLLSQISGCAGNNVLLLHVFFHFPFSCQEVFMLWPRLFVLCNSDPICLFPTLIWATRCAYHMFKGAACRDTVIAF